MSRLHLFNPENDMALGYGRGSFTLSPMVDALRIDGASLPIWYASEGDWIYDARADENRPWYDRISELFKLDVNVSDRVPEGMYGAPWGWSHEVCGRFAKLGVRVPSPDTIDKIRMLSHRRLTSEVMTYLYRRLPSMRLPSMPVEAMSVKEVRNQHNRYGSIYVKAPWSSSGRGVFKVDGWSDKLQPRLENIIRRQGSVMCEPSIDKKLDFAMEFYSDGKTVKWIAYSLFFNEHGASYSGNILAPDSEIEAVLMKAGADLADLGKIKSVLEEYFTDVAAPYYIGYFGVDMMLAEDGMIVPCVEVNLRMTMGVVAAMFCNRFLHPSSRGKYYVAPLAKMPGEETAVVEDGKLLCGRMNLVPTSGNSRFAFIVEAESES